MALMLTDLLVTFDHLKHTVTILANADLDAEPDVERAYALAAQRIAEARARSKARCRGPSARPIDASRRRLSRT